MFPVRKLAELARYATPVGALYDAYPILLLTRASLRALAERSPVRSLTSVASGLTC